MASTDTRLLHGVDVAGTFVLAIHGAAFAIGKNLDLLGILIVAMSTALGGGVIRDLLAGDHPPQALRGWPVISAALAGGVLALFAHHIVEQVPLEVLLSIDALGLSLLTVAGAEKAIERQFTPIAVVLMGAISGAGGYVVRDILLAEIPSILRVDVLASAALLGAAVLLAARGLRVSAGWAALLGGGACLLLRLLAVWLHWNLPSANLH
jgi:uncharacterized membrane protein YeiH